MLWWKVLVLAQIVHFAAGGPAWDKITSLPNLQFQPPFEQYSGYLPVSNGNQLFYWLTMSYKDAANVPTLLYLNGGPGCSSLQGLLVEMGPFRVLDYGAKVVENPYAWNRFANVIYLDAPAGVGYSLNFRQNFTFSDTQVAIDNKLALRAFFERFPELAKNDFYVGGESYAGYYVPMLAAQLLQDGGFPQFKGILIGNGCLNDRLLTNSAVQYNYNHAFIDQRFYEVTVAKCCQGKAGEACNWYDFLSLPPSHVCVNETMALYMANYYTGLDPYFLYFSCYLDQPDGRKTNRRPPIADGSPHSMAAMRKHLLRRLAPGHRAALNDKPACSHYDDMVYWLNRADVRKAIHVPSKTQAYATCSKPVEKNYVTEIDDVSPYVQKAIDAGLRVLFFNGDVDSVCNVVHNLQFVAHLNRTLVRAATPWNFDLDLPATAGLYTAYAGVDFLSVKGGGHFPASSAQKPRESQQMFYNFIHGLDYSKAIPAGQA